MQITTIDVGMITIEYVLTNQNQSISMSIIIEMVHLKSHQCVVCNIPTENYLIKIN